MNTSIQNEISHLLNNLNEKKRLRQKGSILLELFVGVIIIGIMYMITSGSLSGGTDKANATAMVRMAQKLGDNWSLIAQNCGTTTDPANSPVSGNNASNALNLLIGGNTNTATGGFVVPTAYVGCFQQSKVLPMTDSAQWDAGNSKWRVSGYEPTISRATTAGQNYFQIQYAAVPTDLALMIVKNFVPSITTLDAAANTSYAAVHYGAEASGVRTVTIRRPVN